MRKSRGMQGDRGSRTRLIDSGLKPVWSKKSTSSKNFVPLTGPIDTTNVKEVRPSLQIVGRTSNLTVWMAYRMSDDGIVWSSTITDIGGAGFSANGWSFSEGSAADITTDQKGYVQFGANCVNGSGTQVEHGMAQFRFQARDLRGRSVFARQQKVWSDGTTTTIFNPLTKGTLIEDIGEIRATLELIGNSGDVQVQPAYQVSNDGRTWYSGAASAAAGTFTTFGSNRTSEGIDYGTTFTSFSPSEKKKFVRFGTAVKNGSAGKPETGMVNLRIDVRRT